MSLEPGCVVIVYLRDPRERLVGRLEALDPAGVTVRGLGLDSFEDWAAELARGASSALGPSEMFFPMLRLEKLLLDERSGELPSLAERFERRTERSLAEAFGAGR